MSKKDESLSEEDDELRELIERALRDNVEDRKMFKRKKDLTYRLSTVISEYMDSYILLGYDFNGNHVDIKAAPTPQKVEALNSFLMKYFAAEIQSIKGLNPGTDEML
tara:strand:+ start:2637 stop:2957 length:321 start_codon:yes stop_codon:yes gene_type:complete